VAQIFKDLPLPTKHNDHTNNPKRKKLPRRTTASSSYPNTRIQNSKKSNAMSFPRKLHAMLENASAKNLEDVVSWQPGGKSFKVIQPQRFANEIMKNFFNQTMYKSFQRQLNMYGFRRVHSGPNKGGYSHKYFTRCSPELSDRMVRRPVNQSNDSFTAMQEFFDSCSSAADENKNVLQVEPIRLIKDNRSSSFSMTSSCDLKLDDLEVKTLYALFYPEDPDETALVLSSIFDQTVGSKNDDNWFSTEAESSAESFDKSIEEVFSLLSEEDFPNEEHNDDDNDVEELSLSEHSFPWKLHLMLDHAEKKNYSDVVSWVKDGSAFKVHKSREFVEKVMPIYFDQTKYESFRRQLNMYGFTRMSRGEDRGISSHPSFVKGSRYLCENIRRRLS
jgi:hypothetical protein